MIIVEALTLVTIICASAIATWLVKNKYQPEIERVWENHNKRTLAATNAKTY